MASHTSVKLWGAMLVAIPTAIPWTPLTKRFGNVAGSVLGSCIDASKLSFHGTVSFSMSESMVSEIGLNFASVYLIAAAESPSVEPKLPWPSTSMYLIDHDWANLTIAS